MARFVFRFVFSTGTCFQQHPSFVFRFVFGYSRSLLLIPNNIPGSFLKISISCPIFPENRGRGSVSRTLQEGYHTRPRLSSEINCTRPAAAGDPEFAKSPPPLKHSAWCVLSALLRRGAFGHLHQVIGPDPLGKGLLDFRGRNFGVTARGKHRLIERQSHRGAVDQAPGNAALTRF